MHKDGPYQARYLLISLPLKLKNIHFLSSIFQEPLCDKKWKSAPCIASPIDHDPAVGASTAAAKAPGSSILRVFLFLIRIHQHQPVEQRILPSYESGDPRSIDPRHEIRRAPGTQTCTTSHSPSRNTHST